MEPEIELRSYQLTLLQHALKDNSIIFLPTGSGKTLIAIMLIKAMSKQLIGTLEEGGKRTVFICNTISLAKQQFEKIKNCTNLKCGLLTSEQNVDFWKKGRWEKEFNMRQIFVATCQIIVDIVRFNYVSLSNFNLLIFDECHHAFGGHPMHQLMREFNYGNQDDLPRVVGLTAVLIKSSSKQQLFEELQKLETTFRGKIVTVANLNEYHNVLLYTASPTELLIKFSNCKKHFGVTDKINTMIKGCIHILKDNLDISNMKRSKGLETLRPSNPIQNVILLLSDFLFQTDYLGLYGSSYAILSIIIELEVKRRAAETSSLKNNIRMCLTVCEHVRHIIENTLNRNKENTLDNLFKYSTSRVSTFLIFVLSQFKDKQKDDIKCLTFVTRRFTAKCLYYILKDLIECNKSLQIVPDFIVGDSSQMNYTIESILIKKANDKIVGDFSKNITNFIFASNVLEEGIDFQSCNYVIKFDEPNSFLSYVQSKGRVRQKDGFYCIITDLAYLEKTLSKITEYNEIDENLKNHLIHKTIDKPIKYLVNSNKECDKNDESYETVIGSRIYMSSALPLLYRYLTHLFVDRFLVSSLIWNVSTSTNSCKIVELHLPLQSTIKEIIYSSPLQNVQVGKQEVAFKAIKLLHQNGELNDRLLPITNTECIEIVNPKYFEHWNKYKDDIPLIAGTKKMRRLYDIQFPSELINALPIVNKPCHLYNINIVPNNEMKNNNDFIYELFQTNSNYAILTSKSIPRIAKMPLYMSQGELIAEISSNPISTVIYSNEELDALRKFHLMIFHDILNIWNKFFAYDHQNRFNSFLIVPIKNGKMIDWDLVTSFPNLSKMCTPTLTDQKNNIYNANDYVGKIIGTWYNLEETRYAVKKMCTNKTPLSEFPNESLCCSFADYYNNKYNVNVVHLEQNLIEVEPLTKRLNFILPGTLKKNNRIKNEILLIPELCHNFLYPSDMWLKASFLPTILHRLNFALHAENLRVKINTLLNINCSDPPNLLIVDNSIPRVYCTEEKRKSKAFPTSLIGDINQSVEHVLYHNVILDSIWPKHKHPKDFHHDIKQLYAVEIDYFHKYTTNDLIDIEKIDLNYEIDNSVQQKLNDERSTNNLPAIEDISLEEKKNIKILEITLDRTDLKGGEQREFLAAITSANANDVFDMERLEVLGDSFLKFHISLFLFHHHSTWNEGYLTSVKGKFVSNQNLLYCGNNFNLPGILNVTSFEPKGEWLPPLIAVPNNVIEMINDNNITSRILYMLELSESEIINGQCDDSRLNTIYLKSKTLNENTVDSDLNRFVNKQSISDKTCADAVEALIGVCVKNYGIERTFKIIEHLGILPKDSSKENLLKIQFPSPRIKSNISQKEIDSFLINYELIEEKLNYKFKDRAFLLQALTHPSCAFYRITGCYQQLEFIGDAILDFLVSSYIFERCNGMDPGKITDLRSALVNNCTLATISVRNKFHLHMKYNNVPLYESTIKFESFLKTQKYIVTDNVRILQNEKEVENNELIADCVDVPKALGDIFESLIGAVFFDSGNDLNVTWNVIYHLMSYEIHQFMANTPIQLVRQLMECKGANATFDKPVHSNNVCMIKCSFQCSRELHTVHGFGKNKAEAKLSAAKLALKVLNYI